MLIRLLTKNFTKVPLLWVTFDYKLFKIHGKTGSCMLNIHPVLADDYELKVRLNEVVDHIKEDFETLYREYQNNLEDKVYG